jgi:inner membrane protein YidH
MATRASSSLPDATKLAIDRTRLAHERTLMAWVRTATSLISFGFTIYKSFEYLAEHFPKSTSSLVGPRGFGTIMIVIGLVTLIVATIEHRRSIKALREEFGERVGPSLATLVAGLIGLLGVFALFAVAFRQ